MRVGCTRRIPGLTLPQLSLLSGATEGTLKKDPAFKELPAELAAIAEQTPKNDGEGPSAYARRLHAAHPGLTLPQLSLLSGAKEGTLKADPAFKELPAELAAIAEQTPKNDGEGPSAYARRLHAAHPGLTLPQLSLLSGAKEGTLKADPAFKELPAELAAIAEQTPKNDGENASAYARRLHAAHPGLTLPQLSLLSGVRTADLKKMFTVNAQAGVGSE